MLGCLLLCGCAAFPRISHQPTLHNPFPQFTKVAVVPFFNHSTEPTLNGLKVASAYAAELQQVPGFEVMSITVVDQAIRESGITLTTQSDARRLAQLLKADVVVIGAVTDYTPYYPPRMALHVEWYAANPNFHPIPPGYGLPWGTPAEKEIPGPLILEAEMALAKAQLDTQTPPYQPMPPEPPKEKAPAGPPPGREAKDPRGDGVRQASHQAPASESAAADRGVPGIPPNWPDPRGFVPAPPLSKLPAARPTVEPVMTHTRTYRGTDPDFTESLESYVYFQNDGRLAGWQGYLQRSDDFIRFCCHRHIWEMLSARGGAGESRVVWRWSINR